MATNIRGHRVVAPGCTAEYDRIARSSPFGIIAAGVGLWAAGSLAAIGVGLDETILVVLLLLSMVVGAAGIWAGSRLGLRNAQRLTDICRDLTYLRAVAVFDERAATDENVWAAAGIANDLERLEDDSDRLAGARIRTAEQDEELADREYRMRQMTERIFALVT